jgi:hypothetical protein
LIVSGKCIAYLDSDFNVEQAAAGVAVDRHVPPGVPYLRGLDGLPDRTASLRDDPGQFTGSDTAADDGDGATADALDSDRVTHADGVYRAIGTVNSCGKN